MNITWIEGPWQMEPTEGIAEFHARVPDEFLAELAHFDYEDLGERVVTWRLNLAKFDADGELVTESRNFRGAASEGEAKKWAEDELLGFWYA